MHHCVLIGAEFLDPLSEKGIGGILCLVAGDGPAKRFKVAEMVAELLGYEPDHFACDFVGFESGDRWRGEIILGRLAIVGVVVPVSADRLAVLVHEDTGLPAHLAVELFHRQVLATVCPVAEFGMAANEAVVGQYLDFAAKPAGPFLDLLLHSPFARFGDVDRARIMAFDRARDLAGGACQLFAEDGDEGGFL